MKIKLGDVSINYFERGMPQGLPVVFIHGFPFDHTMWEPQMLALPNEYRAIAYDVRGHGESDVADGIYSIEFFVDDLIALLDHLVLKQVVLCGLSMGGYIALRAAERHPDRVKGLILCDTRSEADPNEGRVKRSASIKAVKTNGVKAFADGFVKAVFTPQTFDKNPSAVEKIKQTIIANSPLGICGTLLALASRTDTTASLSNIKAPTLIMVGEHDALTPVAASQSMHEKIAGSELVVISNAAHMSNLENPDAFNSALLKFLKKF
ncbi:MAG: alpha/beta fold hydrolase [Ignavibacteriae bacterium]|nr:alpha/beta fold hydrolase [Ignavibacteriota bacterium]